MPSSSRTLLCAAAALLAAACSSTAPQKAKEPPKPPEPLAARKAFHQTFITARTWAQDLELLRVATIPVSVKAPPGTSAAWEITFVSPSKGRARTYTYSLVEEGSLRKDVYGGLEESFSGSRGQSTPFPAAAFKTDSTDAWETAAEKSKDYMQKNPDKPISFVLEKTPRHPNPAWRVIWGTSAATSNYSVYVDASTGEFLERMH